MERRELGQETCWGAGGTSSDPFDGKRLRRKSHLGPNNWAQILDCACGDAVFLLDPVSELLTWLFPIFFSLEIFTSIFSPYWSLLKGF